MVGVGSAMPNFVRVNHPFYSTIVVEKAQNTKSSTYHHHQNKMLTSLFSQRVNVV